jgi:hypothetical protein
VRWKTDLEDGLVEEGCVIRGIEETDDKEITVRLLAHEVDLTLHVLDDLLPFLGSRVRHAERCHLGSVLGLDDVDHVGCEHGGHLQLLLVITVAEKRGNKDRKKKKGCQCFVLIGLGKQKEETRKDTNR